MSVNEVKVHQIVVDDFVIKGGHEGDDGTARTFVLGHEDHTLGNALRHVLISDANVEFAGYSVPHPSEPKLQVRVQTTKRTTAPQALRTACQTLSSQCDFVLEKLRERLPEVKEDEVQLEQHLEKFLEDEIMQDEGDDEEIVEE
jgi:DNA-directed RNA polymerase I and III subunit RPAC2